MQIRQIIDDFLNRSVFRRQDVTEVALNQFEREQRHIFDKIDYQRKTRIGVNRLKTHPVEVLTEKPVNSLILTLPIAFVILIVGFFFLVTQYGIGILFTSTLLDDIFIIAVLVATVPLAFLDLRWSRRQRNLEDSLPNFFRDVAGMNESGMTLPNAIHVVAEGEYGDLTPYIRKLDAEMSWNVPFVEAIYRFGTRLATPLAERSVDLIAKASKAGGDVSEVLRAAAVDSYEFVNLDTERRNNMLIYVIIVIVSFFVFLFVIAVMTGTFLKTMAEAGAAVAATGSAGATAFGATIDMFFYTRLFSHAAMIQGFFSGLVAGQMGEGSAIAGLKYSVVMLVLAWIAFRFFI
ncbi:MAG: type II secretion system F family protein [Methanomicrobiales archaeon]|nr:type II secretion system F family protein [Methanomicrobiales archaeon]